MLCLWNKDRVFPVSTVSMLGPVGLYLPKATGIGEARVGACEVTTKYGEVSVFGCLPVGKQKLDLSAADKQQQENTVVVLHGVQEPGFSVNKFFSKNVCFQTAGKETEKPGSVKAFWLENRVLSWPSWPQKEMLQQIALPL